MVIVFFSFSLPNLLGMGDGCVHATVYTSYSHQGADGTAADLFVTRGFGEKYLTNTWYPEINRNLRLLIVLVEWPVHGYIPAECPRLEVCAQSADESTTQVLIAHVKCQVSSRISQKYAIK